MDRKFKSLLSGAKWHGSPDITWVDRCEPFQPKKSVNAPSKYMFLSQTKEVAETYAGTSDFSIEKAKIGLGSFPSQNAGVRSFRIASNANAYHIKNLVQTATHLGVNITTIADFEKLLDKIKGSGYDVVINGADANNLIILNEKKVINDACVKR